MISIFSNFRKFKRQRAFFFSKIMNQYQLRSDLQSIFDEFSKLKKDYCNSKMKLRQKDDVINLQNSTMETANRRLDVMSAAIDNYQRIYRDNMHKLQGNNYQLTKRIEDLEERCRNLQQVNRDLIIQSNRDSNEQVNRLENTVTILERRIAENQEKHREEMEQLKEQHAKEISSKIKYIDQLNEQIRILLEQRLSQKEFVHPALYDEVGKLRNHPVAKKKSTNSAFKWPSLDVHKFERKVSSIPPKKKKKLYHEDATELVNLN